MDRIWVLATPYFHALVLILMAAIWYDLRRTIDKKLPAEKRRSEETAPIHLLQQDNPLA